MKPSILRKVSAVLLALALAALCLPAPLARAATEHVSVEVIGPNAEGVATDYAAETSYEVGDDDDAWTLTQRLLDDNGLAYDAQSSTLGVMLVSITSPVDGTVLAYDEASGRYWQLFVDGAASEVGVSGVSLSDGMRIVWYYSAFGEGLPESVEPPAADPAAGEAAGASDAGSGGFPVLPVVGVAVAAGIAVLLYLRSRRGASVSRP